MSKIDFNQIDKYVEANKKLKPQFVAVDDQEWADALDGYREVISESIGDDVKTTQEVWTLIYFCAISFCRGMEREQVLSGKIAETNYPRY
jgi:hypothetical protein